MTPSPHTAAPDRPEFSGSVVVVGSINMDIAVTCARLPLPGETLLADSLLRSGGGKGANQAVGASRAGGARTAMVGAVGHDGDGTTLLADLRADGVDVDAVVRLDLPTGTALITIDSHAENTIVVAAGANAAVEVDESAAATIATADVLLAQLEIPQEAVLAAARARRPGALFILNAAPSAPLPEELLAQVDLLIVNEHEALDLASVTDLETALTWLVARTPAVLVTLGAAGSRLLRRDIPDIVVDAPEVQAIDTVAAGDTFCGVLAAWLAQGSSEPEAMRAASAAASLAVQRHGAQASVPTRVETLQQVRQVYSRTGVDQDSPARG
ncbi:MAG: ribokinase [Lapillicoccus sp.]